MQHRGLEHRGERDLEVEAGQPRQRVLVAEHLTLLGDLDRSVEAAVGLGQHGLTGRATAATDRAAAAVEEPEHDAVLAPDVAQGALGAVDLPLGRGDARRPWRSRSSRA